ncbi:hypothetical protein ANAPC5_01457 [Anaplasma phagocytophilum]|nr:hypothetical protein ANAPC5_01457 [Anaplasma phagocytophilum]
MNEDCFDSEEVGSSDPEVESHAMRPLYSVPPSVRTKWTARAIPADPATGESRVTCRLGRATQGAQGHMTLSQRRIAWDGF